MTRRLLGIFLICVWSHTGLFALSVDVSESPQSNLMLTLRTIASAKKNLRINAYELESLEIEAAIQKRIADGITVEILQEGEPVAGISSEGLAIQKRLAKKLSESLIQGVTTGRYSVMTGKASNKPRRYRYDHAKYIIVDDSSVLVGSENYSASGNPVPGSKKGTRGWQTLIHDSGVAAKFRQLFEDDANPTFGDIKNLVRPVSTFFATWGEFATWPDSADRTVDTFEAVSEPRRLDADRAELITSPDTSLSGLVKFIRDTKRTLDLQLMSLSPTWGSSDQASPLNAEILAAARRGVKVRILLNDPTCFGSGSQTAANLVKYFNRLAKKEGLPLHAKLADAKAMGVGYIHNKGALADGERTLVSSINWNQNSVENNRETALALTSESINQHYQAIFNQDWNARP